MTDSNMAFSTDNNGPPTTVAPLPTGWLADRPWITFLLPFIVFMLATSFEPTPPPKFEDDQKNVAESSADEFAEQTAEPTDEPKEGFFAADRGEGFFPAISYSYYPHVYTAKIALVLLTILLVWPGYRTFPLRISGLSILIGVVGVVLWVASCHLRLEPLIIGPIDRFLGSIVSLLPGLGGNEDPSIGLMSIIGTGERSSFNPLKEMAHAGIWAYAFLAVRFVGLAVVVPVIEEFFLRGFMMRFLVHSQWWQVPIGAVNRSALIAGTAIPMLMHPGELFASLVWFSMVTWLMLRTRNIWDCVVAHAVTNFLLGVYVVWFDQWQLM